MESATLNTTREPRKAPMVAAAVTTPLRAGESLTLDAKSTSARSVLVTWSTA
jgi:hypothetical protein